jgi:hypothetical protein
MSIWLDPWSQQGYFKLSDEVQRRRLTLESLDAGAATDRLRTQMLELMRRQVFEAAQATKDLEKLIDAAPQRVYVSCRLLDFGENGVERGEQEGTGVELW